MLNNVEVVRPGDHEPVVQPRKQAHSTPHSTPHRRPTHHSDTPRSWRSPQPDSPYVSRWGTTLKCAVLRLINLTNISSNPALESLKTSDVLFDSGANCCVTNRRDDFVGPYHVGDGTQVIDGIGKGLRIQGRGHVAWTFKADNGMYRTIKVPCFYVPTGNCRINRRLQFGLPDDWAVCIENYVASSGQTSSRVERLIWFPTACKICVDVAFES